MPSPRTPFTDADEARLIAALPRHSLRNRLLIMTGLHCGFRATELGRMTVGHVWSGTQVRSAITMDRHCLKGGSGVHRRAVRSRTVPLSPMLQNLVHEYLRDRFGEREVDLTAPLFPGECGHGLSRWQINRVVHVLAADAGCTDGRFGSHSLRKTFAGRVYRASGFDINLTRLALGHQHINTTVRYLSVDASEIDAAILAAAASPQWPLPTEMRPESGPITFPRRMESDARLAS